MTTNKPSSRTRSLTDEEKRMWSYVTRHDKKLAGRQPPVAFPPPLGGRSGGGHDKHGQSDTRPHPSPPPNGEGVRLGAYANIDRNTAERFRKGHYPIDATLDLHGMNREKAYIALAGFLRSLYEQGSRCLLVITGKGMQQDAPRGLLREMLPLWLDEPGLRPMVLAFDVAKPKHGGAGAYYILLRRKR